VAARLLVEAVVQGGTMIQETTKTGKELERWVADAYRQMGARKVEHDVPMAGNQIDVYVELETPGRLLHCIAIEVKDWSKPVGIDVVNGFATITKLLHNECLIDEGIIVSASGFSRPARNAAETYDVRLLEPADLEAMVVTAQTVARTWSTASSGPPPSATHVVQRQPETAQAANIACADVPSKPRRTESLDARILQILHDYLQAHPGDHKISINELVGTSGTERDDILLCLLGLREKGWLDYDLTERAESGLVWLTRLGTRVAKDADRN
jgi:hypothetical protein